MNPMPMLPAPPEVAAAPVRLGLAVVTIEALAQGVSRTDTPANS